MKKPMIPAAKAKFGAKKSGVKSAPKPGVGMPMMKQGYAGGGMVKRGYGAAKKGC